MHTLFYHIYCWVQRNKLFSSLIAFVFLLVFGFFASRIKFEEDITQIIPQNKKSDLTSKAIKQINFSDKVTVLIQKGSEGSVDEMVTLANAFLDSVARDTINIGEIRGQIAGDNLGEMYDFVYDHLPLFLDTSDYSSIADKIESTAIREKMASNYEELMTPSSFVLADFIQKDPLGFGLLGLQKLQKLNVNDNFTLYEGFVVSKDTSNLLLFLTPRYEGGETDKNTALANTLYSLQSSLNKTYSTKSSLSYFGSALVAAENAKQIKGDILRTVLISMAILMVLLVLFYRRLYIPLLVFIPTIFATVFAIACLYLYKPVISAISLSIGAVLIGITIDYSLHILTHFKRNSDVKTLYKELTKPLLMSGTTNAVAFLCLLFVHSKALVDLGIFASITLISSAVFTLLIIPHLYKAKEELKHNSLLDRLSSFPFEKSKPLIFLCSILIVVSLFTGRNVSFNNDLSALNYMSPEMRATEASLDKLTNTQAKSLYVVATGNTLDTALKRNEEVAYHLSLAKQRNEVLDYSGVGSILESRKEQADKIAQWNSFWHYHNKGKVINELKSASVAVGFEEEAHEEFYDFMQTPFDYLRVQDFNQVPNLGIHDFVVERNGFFTVSSLVKLNEDKRAEIVKEMESIPGVVVVDRKHLNETFLGKLRDDFNTLIGYSTIAILLILWLFFKRIELVLLAAIPIGLTGLVTAGLMGLFGLEFNIFSAIVCTLVFGHGVDFSIFMTAALQKQYSTGEDNLQTFRTSILLAVLTTVLAIGALVFAKHPALISISSVSLIGVLAAVLITFVFYPIIFRYFITDRAKEGKSPFTISIFITSALLFLYYGLGCIFLSFIGRFVLSWFPADKEQKEAKYRKWISAFMNSVLKANPYVKNKIINPSNEQFHEPSVIIGNHASFLDTLSMGMLIPKMVFVVNDWVWSSPIFGKAVQHLGFFPIRDGVENSIDLLREKVVQGFSIVVFPEGTRSYDNVPKRFHKGAFYLAEQLQLDVVPVYLHGNGDVLPKGDIMISPGVLTSIVGKRIKIDDRTFGEGYSDRTKKIGRFFKDSYSFWRQQLENENYFINRITTAYLFKEDEVIDAVKTNFLKYKTDLFNLNQLLSGYSSIVHWDDSYGELSFLLSLQEGNRRVIGVISDIEHCEIARSIYWNKSRKISFEIDSVQGEILVVSKKMEDKDWKELDECQWKLIISLNKENSFSILESKGYQLAHVGHIEVYSS